MAELLNGSHFNYILLGSPENANSLVRVVLVAKTGPETPGEPAQAAGTPPTPSATPAEAPEAEAAADDATPDDSAEQNAADADQQPADQPGVKSPQQLLQEMQQRQLMLQQQQQGGNPPAMPAPHQPQPQQDQ
jgi:hypothetical protein